jgi:hypothetical protein
MSGTIPGDDRLLDYLRLTQVGRHEAVDGQGLEPALAVLRAWQSVRLAATHADLLAHPRFAPACRFFLSDVYAPRDFSQRDHDITRVYHSMRRILPPEIRRSLELVIELNIITNSLDRQLAGVLSGELGMADTLTAELYAEGFRRCNNYDERAQQIELIVTTGRAIDKLIHRPAVGLALRLARAPAYLGGWHELQDFLERGYAAFKHMGHADAFLQTIAGRERRILDQIYAAHPDPFTLAE